MTDDPAAQPSPGQFGFVKQSGQKNARNGQYLNRLGQCIVSGITGLPMKMVRPLWLSKPSRQPAKNVDWCGVGYGVVNTDLNPVRTFVTKGDTYCAIGRHEIIRFNTVFYGPNSMEKASSLRDGLVFEDNLLALKRMGFAYRDGNDVTPIPELINNTWVERADFSFTVRRHTRRFYPQGLFSGLDLKIYPKEE